MDFLKKISIIVVRFFVFNYLATLYLFNEANASLEISNPIEKETNRHSYFQDQYYQHLGPAVDQSIDAVVHDRSKYVTAEYWINIFIRFMEREYYTMPKEERKQVVPV